MTLPYSTRLTVPLTISPTRLMYSSYMRSRSASRTFCTMTCLADWAAMRPNSMGGSGSVTKSPSLAASLRACGVLEPDLAAVFLDRLDHFEQAPHARLAGLGVDLDPDIGLGAVAGLGRLLDRVLHRLDDDHAIDRLFAGDGIGDLEQFQSVRANGHLVDLLGGRSSVCRVSVEFDGLDFFIVVDREFVLVELRHVHERVGHHQLGFGQQAPAAGGGWGRCPWARRAA